MGGLIMSVILNATTSNGMTMTPDNSGAVQFQSNGTNTVGITAAGSLTIPSGQSLLIGSNQATNGPAFSCYPNAQQTISNATFTLVANQVKDYDTNTCYNNTGSTVTLNGLSVPAYAFCPNVAGYYMFTGAVQYGSTVTAALVQLYKNGGSTQKRGTYSNGGSTSGTSVAAMFYLNGTGDYVQLYTYQGSGSSQATDGTSSDWPFVQYFQGCMLRGA